MSSGTRDPPSGPEKWFSLESEPESGKCATLLGGSLWGALRELIWGSLSRSLLDSFLGRLGGAPGAHFGGSSEGLGGGFGTHFGFTILIYAGGRGKQPEQNGAESKQILIPTWKASVALFSGFLTQK